MKDPVLGSGTTPVSQEREYKNHYWLARKHSKIMSHRLLKVATIQ